METVFNDICPHCNMCIKEKNLQSKFNGQYVKICPCCEYNICTDCLMEYYASFSIYTVISKSDHCVHCKSKILLDERSYQCKCTNCKSNSCVSCTKALLMRSNIINPPKSIYDDKKNPTTNEHKFFSNVFEPCAHARDCLCPYCTVTCECGHVYCKKSKICAMKHEEFHKILNNSMVNDKNRIATNIFTFDPDRPMKIENVPIQITSKNESHNTNECFLFCHHVNSLSLHGIRCACGYHYCNEDPNCIWLHTQHHDFIFEK